jgi:aminoglycoside 6'-N-acetyltransferase I
MRPADAAEVLAMMRELWPDSAITGFDDECYFVFEGDDGRLVGFASMSVRPFVDGSDSEPCPHLEGWYVAPELRRKGVGKALVAAVEVWCRDNGYDELTSDALVSNTVSLEAHERLGFVPTERLQYFAKRLRK